MTTIVILSVLAALAAGAAHPRTRRFFIAENTPPALPPGSQSVEEWKRVFRETVISVDGGLSPEMEAWLSEKPALSAPNLVEEFRADFNAAARDWEKISVLKRWQAKKFVVPSQMRSKILEAFFYASERNQVRKIFDAMDKRR